ncbi:MAG: cytochrome b N-terminal domain-containing protein [Planctomycetota bacterium]
MTADPQRRRRNRKGLRSARRALRGPRSRLAAFFAGVVSLRIPPAYRGLRWLSAAILVLLGVELVTGVLLSLYYYPAPGAAYQSVRHLNSVVPAGWLVRGLHSWAGDLLLAAVLGHLLVVFFRRAYRPPRELQWVVGVLLVPAVLSFQFTGRLLPWDTVGDAATRLGLGLLESVPVIGSWAATWLRGGEDMGANTLSRFFTTHVLILPWLVVLLIGVHIHLVRRHGLRGGDG